MVHDILSLKVFAVLCALNESDKFRGIISKIFIVMKFLGSSLAEQAPWIYFWGEGSESIKKQEDLKFKDVFSLPSL